MDENIVRGLYCGCQRGKTWHLTTAFVPEIDDTCKVDFRTRVNYFHDEMNDKFWYSLSLIDSIRIFAECTMCKIHMEFNYFRPNKDQFILFCRLGNPAECLPGPSNTRINPIFERGERKAAGNIFTCIYFSTV